MTMTPIYKVGHSTQYEQTKMELDIKALGLKVFFGSKDGKNYAIIAEYKRRGPSRSGGRWHGNPGVYDVYFRENFRSRDAGNNAYLRVKRLFSSFRTPYSGCCECHGNVTVEQIANALSAH